MAPFQFLFQEHIGDLIWRKFRLRRRWVTALDQGQFHPLLGDANPPHPRRAVDHHAIFALKCPYQWFFPVPIEQFFDKRPAGR